MSATVLNICVFDDDVMLNESYPNEPTWDFLSKDCPSFYSVYIALTSPETDSFNESWLQKDMY